MLETRRILALCAAFVACGLPVTSTAQEPEVSVTPDVVYGHKDGMALTLDVFRPASPNGAAVLYMVSGGWVSRWAPPERYMGRFSGLLERGFTVFAVRHGSAPRYKVPEAEADVRRALRYVRLHADELGVDAARLGVFGGSAGGHLSLMLGLASDHGMSDGRDEVSRTPSRVAAVVAYYPPVDIRRMVGPSRRFPALDFPDSLAAGISPILFVTPDDPPTLLIHGDADRLVNIRNSEVMYEALQGASVESDFIVISGGGHGFRRSEDRRRAREAMVEWFDRHLRGESGR